MAKPEALSRNMEELKEEKDLLERQISILKENIESQLLVARQEAAAEKQKANDVLKLLYSEQDKFKIDKAAFQKALIEFKAQKDAFEKDRAGALASKKTYDQMKERLDACIEKMRQAMANL